MNPRKCTPWKPDRGNRRVSRSKCSHLLHVPMAQVRPVDPAVIGPDPAVDMPARATRTREGRPGRVGRCPRQMRDGESLTCCRDGTYERSPSPAPRGRRAVRSRKLGVPSRTASPTAGLRASGGRVLEARPRSAAAHRPASGLEGSHAACVRGRGTVSSPLGSRWGAFGMVAAGRRGPSRPGRVSVSSTAAPTNTARRPARSCCVTSRRSG